MYIGDFDYKKNYCFGRVEKGLFYVLKIWLGDFGIKGGVLIDEWVRVLKEIVLGKYEVIFGLYVIGNNLVSVMGWMYVGVGLILGFGFIFGYIVVMDCV